MSSGISTESPLFQKLNTFADLAFLNLLAVVCSLPVITAGAAFTALYYAVEKVKNSEGSPIKSFFHSFRENFAQATLAWLIFLVSGGALCFSILLYLEMDKPVMIACSVLGLLVWGMILSWFLPLEAKFYSTLLGSLKNAFLCATSYLFLSLAMALVNLIPIITLLFIPNIFLLLVPLWLVIWFSFAAWCNYGLLRIPLGMLEAEAEKAEREEAEKEAAEKTAEA